MKSDKEFLEKLEKSKPSVKLVANYYRKQGYTLNIPPTRVRPNRDQRMRYVDQGDIEILINGVWMRLEVKQPTMSFTSLNDYGSDKGYDMVMIDECYKVNRTGRKPLWAYALVSKQMTGFIFVPGETRKSWVAQSKYVKSEGEYRDSYYCEKSVCTYIPVPHPWCELCMLTPGMASLGICMYQHDGKCKKTEGYVDESEGLQGEGEETGGAIRVAEGE